MKDIRRAVTPIKLTQLYLLLESYLETRTALLRLLSARLIRFFPTTQTNVTRPFFSREPSEHRPVPFA